MLFTDGGEDRASEIFDEYNSEKKVRNHMDTHTNTHINRDAPQTSTVFMYS